MCLRSDTLSNVQQNGLFCWTPRKQTKQALQDYNKAKIPDYKSTIPFNLDEIKSIEALQKNIREDIVLLHAKTLEKIGIGVDTKNWYYK